MTFLCLLSYILQLKFLYAHNSSIKFNYTIYTLSVLSIHQQSTSIFKLLYDSSFQFEYLFDKLYKISTIFKCIDNGQVYVMTLDEIKMYESKAILLGSSLLRSKDKNMFFLFYSVHQAKIKFKCNITNPYVFFIFCSCLTPYKP